MKDRLIHLLSELGCKASLQPISGTERGFPVRLGLPDGSSIWIELPEPTWLEGMNPDQIGLAIVDGSGQVLRRWGLAEKLDEFDGHKSMFDSPLSHGLEAALQGPSSSVYHEGHRYWICEIENGSASDLLILVTNAHEEKTTRHSATKSGRSAEVLKRIGKALTMNQTLDPLCGYVVNEIVSANELAAALLWVRSSDERTLELIAHLGVNRQGVSLLQTLNPRGGTSCLAEFVAGERKPFRCRSVDENIMTNALEAKICYLKPGAVHVLPLVIGDKTIGVLELLGKEGERSFWESGDLFETIAEHLALAINSAMMFESVERLALYDALTGIANHRTMQDFLVKRVGECQRNGQEMGVIMIDVDHFRSFNEEEGHDAGDDVLRLVANVLRESIRPYDLAARYGGEEFTLIMPSVGLEATRIVAERIRQRISEIPYQTRSGRTRHITASFGFSMFPETSEDPQALLKAADEALFLAKRNGRNRVEAYEGPYHETSQPTLLDLNPLEEFLTKAERLEAARYRQSLEPLVTYLARELSLSRAQEQLLFALVQIAPLYIRWKAKGQTKKIAKLITSNEARPLVPSLLSLQERFDGHGPEQKAGDHIPLLGRILSVLMAIELEPAGALNQDTGRFDPEIVAIASACDLAA